MCLNYCIEKIFLVFRFFYTNTISRLNYSRSNRIPCLNKNSIKVRRSRCSFPERFWLLFLWFANLEGILWLYRLCLVIFCLVKFRLRVKLLFSLRKINWICRFLCGCCNILRERLFRFEGRLLIRLWILRNRIFFCWRELFFFGMVLNVCFLWESFWEKLNGLCGKFSRGLLLELLWICDALDLLWKLGKLLRLKMREKKFFFHYFFFWNLFYKFNLNFFYF